MKALGRAALFAAVLLGAPAYSATPTIALEPMQPNLDDKPSLQRGMRLYMNYCIGCHSLKFQRYERTAHDLGIPNQVALDNLIFTDQAIGDLMTAAIPSESAKNWFGAPPPDLTMVRSRTRHRLGLQHVEELLLGPKPSFRRQQPSVRGHRHATRTDRPAGGAGVGVETADKHSICSLATRFATASWCRLARAASSASCRTART